METMTLQSAPSYAVSAGWRMGATAVERQEAEEQSPITLMDTVVENASSICGRWGEEIFLHLRVAALWHRLGRTSRAVEFLSDIGAQHVADAFHLGDIGVRMRLDYIRYFLSQIGADEALVYLAHRKAQKKKENGPVFGWFVEQLGGRRQEGLSEEITFSLLSMEDEQEVREVLTPTMSWYEQVYLTPISSQTDPHIAQQILAVDDNGAADIIEAQTRGVVDACRNWHERRSDTPIWVHDLDDIGPRVAYLAIRSGRPSILGFYLMRALEALDQRPLALMPNTSFVVGGLAYLAFQHNRASLLHYALQCVKRLPEHEQCLSALAVGEVLLERGRFTC